jgi:hypothetical protein
VFPDLHTILFGAVHICTHANPLLRTHLRRPIPFKQYGSERLPVDVDPLPAQGFNFNNVRVVRAVAILGDMTEGSGVIRRVRFRSVSRSSYHL